MRPHYRRTRRPRYALLLSAAGVLLGAAPVRPQALPDSGRLVRVQLQNTRKIVGRVVRFGRDTLTLAVSDVEGRRLVGLPRSELARTWVSVGHSRRTLQGLGIGLLAGGVLGGTIGAATYTPCHSQEFLGCLFAPGSRGAAALLGAGVGGSLGLVIGGIAGVATVRQDWQPVDLPAAVTFAPAGGLGLAVSLPF